MPPLLLCSSPLLAVTLHKVVNRLRVLSIKKVKKQRGKTFITALILENFKGASVKDICTHSLNDFKQINSAKDALDACLEYSIEDEDALDACLDSVFSSYL
jgi:phage terminase large subunit